MNEFLLHPVSVVGNAESIFNHKHGYKIDKNPTIRFNRANIIDQESQGSRWDYLVSSEINTFEKYNQEEPKFHTLIFSPTKKEFDYKIRKVKFESKIFHLPLSQSQLLETKLTASPSTGMQILFYLDSIHNNDVSIFGFDFKATRTFYEIRNKGNHDFQKEKNLILELVQKNNWKFYN